MTARRVDRSPPGPAAGYPGGKNGQGTFQWLLNLQASHAYYAEPFVGSGGLLRRKVPAMRTVVCDRDRHVIRWWKQLRWPGVEARLDCGIRWLERAAGDLDEEWLVYLDPPYPLATRTKKRLYRFEMTAVDHRRLMAITIKLGCRVMVSSYSSPDYERALSGWWREERRVITRGGTMRTEVVWCNYDPAAAPAAVKVYVGRDYRERERIAKKVRRWRANYSALGHDERRAILNALIDAEASLANGGGEDVTGADVGSRPSPSSAEPATSGER